MSWKLLLICASTMLAVGCASMTPGFNDQVSIWLEITRISTPQTAKSNQPIVIKIDYLGSEARPDVYIGEAKSQGNNQVISIEIIHKSTKQLPYTNFREPSTATASFTPTDAGTYIFEGIRREGLTNVNLASSSVVVTTD
ncbi:hypothetical protein D3C72_1465670 [compost metagenome]